MRSYDSHLVNLSELEKGSIDELKSKHGRNADCELRTQGVKGRSKILSVIPNQPLSSPIDPMHQLFLGVTKELLGYFYDKMFSSEKKELNEFLNLVLLPKELKNSVRGLDFLSNFKAKELKAFLFYLSPIVLPPFFHGENRSSDELDLKKLVFATRQLFDTTELSDFYDTLLNQFCRSMADKTTHGVDQFSPVEAPGMASKKYWPTLHYISIHVRISQQIIDCSLNRYC